MVLGYLEAEHSSCQKRLQQVPWPYADSRFGLILLFSEVVFLSFWFFREGLCLRKRPPPAPLLVWPRFVSTGFRFLQLAVQDDMRNFTCRSMRLATPYMFLPSHDSEFFGW